MKSTGKYYKTYSKCQEKDGTICRNGTFQIVSVNQNKYRIMVKPHSIVGGLQVNMNIIPNTIQQDERN